MAKFVRRQFRSLGALPKRRRRLSKTPADSLEVPRHRAEMSTRWRGHVIDWAEPVDGTAEGTCTKCGAKVTITDKVSPRGVCFDGDACNTFCHENQEKQSD